MGSLMNKFLKLRPVLESVLVVWVCSGTRGHSVATATHPISLALRRNVCQLLCNVSGSNVSDIKLYLSETEHLFSLACTELGKDVSGPRDKCLPSTEQDKHKLTHMISE